MTLCPRVFNTRVMVATRSVLPDTPGNGTIGETKSMFFIDAYRVFPESADVGLSRNRL